MEGLRRCRRRSGKGRRARNVVSALSHAIWAYMPMPGLYHLNSELSTESLYFAAIISRNLSPIAFADIGLSPVMTSRSTVI